MPESSNLYRTNASFSHLVQPYAQTLTAALIVTSEAILLLASTESLLEEYFQSAGRLSEELATRRHRRCSFGL